MQLFEQQPSLINEPLASMTDEDLIKGCIKGDQLAQKTLYDRYAGKMMGVCLRYSNSNEDAADVLQDGFIKIFEKLSSYKHQGSFEGWIRRIFVNTALDHIRKHKNQRLSVDMDSVDFKIASTDDVMSTLAAEDLLKILQKIPAGYRAVFNLYAIEGYSHQEIAEELEISVNTSKSQYSRAKGFLRKIIDEQDLR